MFSSPLVLQIPSSMQMTDEQFFEFCQINRNLRIERNKFLLVVPAFSPLLHLFNLCILCFDNFLG